jgi:hypothetical protein
MLPAGSGPSSEDQAGWIHRCTAGFVMTVQALQPSLIPLEVQAGPAGALKENAVWGLPHRSNWHQYHLLNWYSWEFLD